MATYTDVGGVVECTGTDITSAGIASFIDANPSVGTATYTTSGNRDVYHFAASIRIGNGSSGPAASIWDASNQFVALTCDVFEIYGRFVMGGLDGNSDSQNGGALSVTISTGGNPNDNFRLYSNGQFRAYGSYIYASNRIRADSDIEFWVIDCDLELEDSVSPGEGGSSFGQRQDFDYSRSRIHHANSVGIKLYSFESNPANQATFNLTGTKVEGCKYAFQLGQYPTLTVSDVEIDTNTFHTVPNLGTGSNITFVNADFTTLRTDLESSDDLSANEFRYALTVNDTTGSPISGATVRIIDENGDDRFDTTTDANGNPTTFPQGTLQNSTYAGSTRTERNTHDLIVRKYGLFWSELTRTADADNLGDTVPMPSNGNVTQSSAAAQAHTGITITEEVSPVSWQGKLFGLTITGDLTVNPSLTADDMFHALQYHLSLSTSYNGKKGTDWHNMVAAGFETVYAEAGSRFYGGVAKGVRAIDQAGNSFPGFTRHQSDDGTYYVVPTSYTIKTSGLISNSNLLVKNITKSTTLVNAVQATDWSLTYVEGVEISAGDTIEFFVAYHASDAGGALFKEPLSGTVIASAGDTTISISQVDWDAANAMSAESPVISDGALLTEFALDAGNIQIDVDDPDGTSEFRRLALWYAYQLAVSDVAIDQFFGALTFIDEFNIRVNRTVIGLQIENVSTTHALRFSDGSPALGKSRRFYTDDGSDIIAPSSAPGSIQIEQGVSSIGAQSAFTDILIALDLAENTPNTYRNDKTKITNDKFTRTRTPAGNSFTITRSDT